MLNSGEGGFLLTDDDTIAAKAMCYAGSYEKLYVKHSCPRGAGARGTAGGKGQNAR